MAGSSTVFKLGGSLLDLPNLVGLVHALSAQRPGNSHLFVVGGGTAADSVRKWQPSQNLTDEQSHWLAIEAMGFNEELLQVIVPELRVVRSGPQLLAAWKDGAAALLCAPCFVRWGEAIGFTQLPRDWRVTSDSIAAWVAQGMAADELVLVKSQPLILPRTVEQAAADGLVDGYFPECAAHLPSLCWCNGRNPDLRIERWH